MKVALLTAGTRGDVQPFVALGLALRRRGHDVLLCASREFEPFVRERGLDFAPHRGDYSALARSEAGKRMLAGNPFAVAKQMQAVVKPMIRGMLDDLWLATADADALICHPKTIGGPDIAAARGVPAFAAHPAPILAPTGAFTNPALPFAFGNRRLNEWSYAANRLMTFAFRDVVRAWRRETLALPNRVRDVRSGAFEGGVARGGSGEPPILCGCSPSVVPYDPRWRGRVCMEGFWYLPEADDWRPPEALAAFLAEGPPPVAIGFSSMPLKRPDAALAAIKDAVRRSGQRVIVLAGDSGMTDGTAAGVNAPGDALLIVREAPHDWLFPRTAGVVHHGGAGTTAAALKAGTPMVVCPFGGDQPFWARRTAELGVAAPPLRERDWSAERLAERLRALAGDARLRANALALAERVRAERGADETAAFVERWLEHSKKPPSPVGRRPLQW